MKSVILILALLISIPAFSQENAQENEEKKCEATYDFRTFQGQLDWAIAHFKFTLEELQNDCELVKAANVQEKENFRLVGVRSKGSKLDVEYDVMDFSDRTDRTCKITITYEMVQPKGPGPVAAIAEYTRKIAAPVCSKRVKFD